jgi:tetratricopeptide (TPR) repeat protein
VHPFAVVAGKATLLAALAWVAAGTSEAAGTSALYLEAVERYRRGDRDVISDDTWPSRMREELAALKRLQAQALNCGECPERALADSFPFEAAAMLHTERDIYEREGFSEEEVVAPGTAPHLDAAREVLALIPDDARRGRFEHPWSLTVTLYLHLRGQWPLARQYVNWALRRYPEDPRLLLARGSLLESQAAVATNALPGIPGRDGRAWEDVGAASVRLREAEESYRRALRAAPDLVEARVRIGRVLHLMGRPGQAAEELAKVVATRDVDPRLRHLAWLFLGAAHEAEGRPADAVTAYREAIALSPDSQVACVALSHALHGKGERTASRKVLQGAVGPTRRTEWEPWGSYRWGQAHEFAGRLEALRHEIAR